ncbi:hypothetical protein M422DRAFT_240853 [Sphaerobolus stellatus SS14]|nr:hypothetical protein M422DRAFT_240853 [Sphaerobolus stellatus SS14]
MVKNVLPDHILDDLAKIWPKPKTYESLRQFVLQIDQHYWQTHCEESRCKARRGPMTSSTSNSNNNANSSNNSDSKSNKSQAPNNSKSKTTTVTVTNTSVPQNNHLGPDGQLMDTERKHRIDTGLCIVCGLKGHIAKDCNKARWNNNQASGSSSNNCPAPKAHTSNTEEKPTTDDKAKAKDSSNCITTVTVTNTSVPQNTHLGPDGQLTDTERKCRIDVGLCIVCGLKGHIAKDCNKARWNNNQASGSGSNNCPVPKACTSNTKEKPTTDDKAKDSASGSKN